MFFHMLMAAQTAAITSTPQLTSLTVARINAGACDGQSLGTPASIRVSWSADNFNSALHSYKVYENDILKTTTTGVTYDKTINGNVEDGPGSQWTSNWTYRVDIVDTATGAVLATRYADPWQVVYGNCRSEA